MQIATMPAQIPQNGKFRILIVGMLKRQVEIIANEFPQLDIVFANKEDRSGTSYGPLIKTADRIIAFGNFISHSIYWKLDRSKLILIHGGLTKLRQALNNIVAFTAHAHTAPALPVAINDGGEVNSDFPSEDYSDMALQKADFSVIRRARPGESFSFVRPDGVKDHVFKNSLFQARSYYKRNMGILSEQEIIGGKATITVTHNPKLVPTPVLDAAETALGAEPLAMAPDIAALMRAFWCDVYKESFHAMPYAPPSTHAEIASAAVDGWLMLFGKGK